MVCTESGVLQVDLVQTMTLELTDNMTMYEESSQKLSFEEKSYPIIQGCDRIAGYLSAMSSQTESNNFKKIIVFLLCFTNIVLIIGQIFLWGYKW